jgi:hypothetical protein
VIFVPIAKERIPFEWERIVSLIGKAIGHDRNASPLDVYAWLTSGRSEAFWVGIPVHVTGLAVTTTEGSVCWINYVGGSVKGGPRAFITACRDVVAEIENLARDVGCTELRLGGRNWSRVFPEWEHFDPNYPNRIRKPLNG